jgi:hypothetical protein
VSGQTEVSFYHSPFIISLTTHHSPLSEKSMIMNGSAEMSSKKYSPEAHVLENMHETQVSQAPRTPQRAPRTLQDLTGRLERGYTWNRGL